MTAALTLKAGDTAPALRITLMDGDLPIDLSSATSILLRCKADRGQLIERTVVGNASGEITYTWLAEDTATAGTLKVEVVVTWPAGKVQTFPADGHLIVSIQPRL